MSYVVLKEWQLFQFRRPQVTGVWSGTQEQEPGAKAALRREGALARAGAKEPNCWSINTPALHPSAPRSYYRSLKLEA
jgi:hypothetical protein